MAGKIFISYRREENAANALSIGQYLEHEFGRKNVFIDVDMRAGAKFPTILEERLRECKVMLALLGPGWISAKDDEGQRRLDSPNDWVRLEIGRALARGITVIPVRVNGADLPKRATLPTDIQSLLDHQAVSVTNTSFRNDMAGLVRDIRAIPAGQKYRRTALAVTAFCVAAMLIGSLWVFKDKWLPTLLSEVKSPLSAENETYSEKDYPALRPGPEWVIYGAPTGGYLSYFKPASIRVFPNRVAVMVRSRVDPTEPINGKMLENAAYQEFQQVFECSSQRAVIAKTNIFDAGGQPIYYYKWGDPEFMDMSIGTTLNPGTIGETLKALTCTPDLRSAYIEQELSDMQFIPLSSTGDGKGQILYKPEKITDAGLATALLVVKMLQETPMTDVIPPNVTKDFSSSKFKYIVQRVSFDCSANTFTSPKMEYYTSQSKINLEIAQDTTKPMPVGEKSPVDSLRQVMCTPKAVEKCEPILPSSGDKLSGIYLGIIGEPGADSEKISVQVKLARNGDSVTGAYYRDGVCGTIDGKVDPDGKFRFQWSWNGNSGRGRAIFANNVLTASSGFGDEEEGGGSLTLFRISPNRGDPRQQPAVATP